ncbi:rRNA methyltransferase [Clostridia bacterium]|nr:rRNA methyltransferase [Clostridia bacterium]
MRVISGTAKRMPLKTVSGMEVRPTSDRIKETLFNVIQYDIPQAGILDLFAGSGGIGIEALSRGANFCVFVDQYKPACLCIRENLAYTRLQDKAEVYEENVFFALKRLEQKKAKVFDIVFLDPPYGKEIEKEVLAILAKASFLSVRTQIIVEAEKHTDFSYVGGLGLSILKEKIYKNNKHVFLAKDQNRLFAGGNE